MNSESTCRKARQLRDTNMSLFIVARQYQSVMPRNFLGYIGLKEMSFCCFQSVNTNVTGLLCHFLGIQNSMQVEQHPLRGASFENRVFSELAKKLLNNGQRLSFYFWRTHGGQEVEFVVEQGKVTHAIEVKSRMTVRPAIISSLEKTTALWEENTVQGWVILDLLVDEYDLSCKAVQYVNSSNDLLDVTPWLARPIEERNLYVNPLNLLQLELMKRGATRLPKRRRPRHHPKRTSPKYTGSSRHTQN